LDTVGVILEVGVWDSLVLVLMVGGVQDFLVLGRVAGVMPVVVLRVELAELGVFDGSRCKLPKPSSNSYFFELTFAIDSSMGCRSATLSSSS
jgi:hypothetical protein